MKIVIDSMFLLGISLGRLMSNHAIPLPCGVPKSAWNSCDPARNVAPGHPALYGGSSSSYGSGTDSGFGTTALIMSMVSSYR